MRGQGAVCEPIRCLEDLLAFDQNSVDNRLKGRSLKNTSRFLRSSQAKTLVCHDMAGGYLEDRFSDGYEVETDKDSFYLLHWWYIDVFVYFSHNFITIPPVGWINIAHKHDTVVLGTIITEWREGAEVCSQLLKNYDTIHLATSHLVSIAKTYNFDGWLVNIENSIKIEDLGKLHMFIRELANRSRSALGDRSMVIWYDSVINSSGRLRWQDELNALNKPFFDECDGIFLNYCWDEASLSVSAVAADSVGRKADVFVGVDVFGRNCTGGFECHRSLESIQKYGLSTAIFAPGWVYEKLPECDFVENLHKFWWSLKGSVICRRLGDIPIESGFGCGVRRRAGSIHGKLHDLSMQDMQPHFLCQDFQSLSTWTTDYCSCYDPAESMETVVGKPVVTLKSSNKAGKLRLFCTKISATNRNITCSFDCKTSSAGLVLAVCFWMCESECADNDRKMILFAPIESFDDFRTHLTQNGCDVVDIYEARVSRDQDFYHIEFDTNLGDSTITGIGFVFLSEAVENTFTLLQFRLL